MTGRSTTGMSRVRGFRDNWSSPVFQDAKGSGDFKIVSFYAKRARGTHGSLHCPEPSDQGRRPSGFDLEGYRFDPAVSTIARPVFRRVRTEVPSRPQGPATQARTRALAPPHTELPHHLFLDTLTDSQDICCLCLSTIDQHQGVAAAHTSLIQSPALEASCLDEPSGR